MIVVTGGGSGIGRALAFSLAKREQSVLIVGRHEKSLQETAVFSSNIRYFCADVSTVNGLETIKNHLHDVPQIKALVNNAGTLSPLALMNDIDPTAWQHTLNTNLNPALFLPQMLYDKLADGRVLNIGSGAAYFAVKGWAAYCVSKAALSMLTKCWQAESESVVFANVMPGIIDTQMQAIARSSENPDPHQTNFYKRLKEHNRLVSPDAVADFLTWLLLDSDKETYISQEWDIYDTKHHKAWLKPPHQILHWDF